MVNRIGLEVALSESPRDAEGEEESGGGKMVCRTRFVIKEKDGSKKTIRANVCKSVHLERFVNSSVVSYHIVVAETGSSVPGG